MKRLFFVLTSKSYYIFYKRTLALVLAFVMLFNFTGEVFAQLMPNTTPGKTYFTQTQEYQNQGKTLSQELERLRQANSVALSYEEYKAEVIKYAKKNKKDINTIDIEASYEEYIAPIVKYENDYKALIKKFADKTYMEVITDSKYYLNKQDEEINYDGKKYSRIALLHAAIHNLTSRTSSGYERGGFWVFSEKNEYTKDQRLAAMSHIYDVINREEYHPADNHFIWRFAYKVIEDGKEFYNNDLGAKVNLMPKGLRPGDYLDKKERSREDSYKQANIVMSAVALMPALSKSGSEKSKGAQVIYEHAKKIKRTDYSALGIMVSCEALLAMRTEESLNKLYALLATDLYREDGVREGLYALDVLSFEEWTNKGANRGNRANQGLGQYYNAIGRRYLYLDPKKNSKELLQATDNKEKALEVLYKGVFTDSLEEIGKEIGRAASKNEKVAKLADKIALKYVGDTSGVQAREARMHTSVVVGILATTKRKSSSLTKAARIIYNGYWWDISEATQRDKNNIAAKYLGYTAKKYNAGKYAEFKSLCHVKKIGRFVDIALGAIFLAGLVLSLPSIVRGTGNFLKGVGRFFTKSVKNLKIKIKPAAPKATGEIRAAQTAEVAGEAKAAQTAEVAEELRAPKIEQAEIKPVETEALGQEYTATLGEGGGGAIGFEGRITQAGAKAYIERGRLQIINNLESLSNKAELVEEFFVETEANAGKISNFNKGLIINKPWAQLSPWRRTLGTFLINLRINRNIFVSSLKIFQPKYAPITLGMPAALSGEAFFKPLAAITEVARGGSEIITISDVLNASTIAQEAANVAATANNISKTAEWVKIFNQFSAGRGIALGTFGINGILNEFHGGPSASRELSSLEKENIRRALPQKVKNKMQAKAKKQIKKSYKKAIKQQIKYLKKAQILQSQNQQIAQELNQAKVAEQQAAQTPKEKALQHYQNALLYLNEEKNFLKALKELDAAILEEDSNSEYYYLRAKINYQYKNNIKSALEDLEKALKYNPDNLDALNLQKSLKKRAAHLAKGIIGTLFGQNNTALSVFGPFTALFVRYFINKGSQQSVAYEDLDTEDLNDTAKEDNNDLQISSQDVPVNLEASYYETAKNLFEQQEYEQALLAIQKAIEENSSKITYYLLRAQIKEALQDYQGAVEDYEQCVRLDPDNAYIYSEKRAYAGEMLARQNSTQGISFREVIQALKDKVLNKNNSTPLFVFALLPLPASVLRFLTGRPLDISKKEQESIINAFDNTETLILEQFGIDLSITPTLINFFLAVLEKELTEGNVNEKLIGQILKDSAAYLQDISKPKSPQEENILRAKQELAKEYSDKATTTGDYSYLDLAIAEDPNNYLYYLQRAQGIFDDMKDYTYKSSSLALIYQSLLNQLSLATYLTNENYQALLAIYKLKAEIYKKLIPILDRHTAEYKEALKGNKEALEEIKFFKDQIRNMQVNNNAVNQNTLEEELNNLNAPLFTFSLPLPDNVKKILMEYGISSDFSEQEKSAIKEAFDNTETEIIKQIGGSSIAFLWPEITNNFLTTLRNELNKKQLNQTYINQIVANTDTYFEQIRREDVPQTSTEAKAYAQSLSYSQMLAQAQNQEKTRINKKVSLIDKIIAHIYFTKGKTAYYEHNNIEEALNKYNIAILYNPEAKYFIERAAIPLNNPELNLRDYDEAVRRAPGNAEYRYKRAMFKLNSLKDYQGALEGFSSAIALDPTNKVYYQSRAMLYFYNLKNKEAALQDLVMAIKYCNPEYVNALKIDFVQWSGGQTYEEYIKAQNNLKKTKENQSVNQENTLNSIGKTFENGKLLFVIPGFIVPSIIAYVLFKAIYDKADSESNAVLEKAQEETRILNIHYERQNFKKEDLINILNYYNQAVYISPKNKKAYELRADFKLRYLKDYLGALEDYAILIRLAPKTAKYYYKSALIKMKLKDKPNVLDDLDKAIKFDSKNAEYRFERGFFKFHYLSDYAGALEDFDMAIKLNSEKAIYHYERAILTWYDSYGVTNKQLAIYDMRKACSLDRNNEYYIYKLQEWQNEIPYVELNNFEKQQQEINEIIAQNHTAQAEKYYLEAVRTKNSFDNYRETINKLNQAISLNPYVAKYYIARAAIKETWQKDLYGALEDYKMARKLEPENGFHYISIAYIYKQLSNKEEALKNLALAIIYSDSNYANTFKAYFKEWSGGQTYEEYIVQNNLETSSKGKNKGFKEYIAGLKDEIFGKTTKKLFFKLFPSSEDISAFLTGDISLEQLLNRTPAIRRAFTIAEQKTSEVLQDNANEAAMQLYLLNLKDALAQAGVKEDKAETILNKAKAYMQRQLDLKNFKLEIEALADQAFKAKFFNQDYKEAVRLYTLAIEKDPKNPSLYLSRAYIYDFDIGDLKLAKADYEKALEVAPENWEQREQVKRELANLVNYMEESAKKKENLFSILGRAFRNKNLFSVLPWVIVPLFATFAIMKTISYISEDLDDEDIERVSFRNKLKAENYFIDALEIRKQDPQRAIELLSLAISHNPYVAKYYFYRANIYKWQKDFTNALRDYTEAVNLEDNARYYLYTAMLYYHQLGNKENALKNLALAIKYSKDTDTTSQKKLFKDWSGGQTYEEYIANNNLETLAEKTNEFKEYISGLKKHIFSRKNNTKLMMVFFPGIDIILKFLSGKLLPYNEKIILQCFKNAEEKTLLQLSSLDKKEAKALFQINLKEELIARGFYKTDINILLEHVRAYMRHNLSEEEIKVISKSYFQKAMEAEKATNWELAEKYYSLVIALDDINDQAYVHRGRVRIQIGKIGEGKQDYLKAIMINPKNIRTYNLEVEHTEGSLYLNDFNEQSELDRAKQAIKDTEYNKALGIYTRLININPKNPLYYFYMADLYQTFLDNYEAALENLNIALQLDTNNALYLYRRGLVRWFGFEGLENKEKAIEDLQAAAEYNTTYKQLADDYTAKYNLEKENLAKKAAKVQKQKEFYKKFYSEIAPKVLPKEKSNVPLFVFLFVPIPTQIAKFLTNQKTDSLRAAMERAFKKAEEKTIKALQDYESSWTAMNKYVANLKLELAAIGLSEEEISVLIDKVLYNIPEVLNGAEYREMYAALYNTKGYEAYHNQEYQLAQNYYNLAQEFDPANPEYSYHRGLVQELQGNYEAAKEEYDNAKKLIEAIQQHNAIWENIINGLKEHLFSSNQNNSAKLYFSIFPGLPFIKDLFMKVVSRSQISINLEIEKAFEKAEQKTRRALSQDDTPAAMMLFMSNLEQELAKTSYVAKSKKEEILHKTHKYIKKQLVKNQEEQKLLDNAYKSYTKAKYKKALAYFTAITEINPNNFEAQYYKAYLQRKFAPKKFMDGNNFFNEITQVLTPKTAEDFFIRGKANYLSGNFKEAIEDYLESLNIYPYNDEVYYNLALLYTDSSYSGYNAKEALNYLQEAITINHNDDRYYFLKGFIKYYDLHDNFEALKDLYEARKINPLNPEYTALINKIEAYFGYKLTYANAMEEKFANGDLNGVDRIANERINSNKNDALAYIYLGKVKAQRGDLQRASLFYNLAVEVDPNNYFILKARNDYREKYTNNKERNNSDSKIIKNLDELYMDAVGGLRSYIFTPNTKNDQIVNEVKNDILGKYKQNPVMMSVLPFGLLGKRGEIGKKIAKFLTNSPYLSDEKIQLIEGFIYSIYGQIDLGTFSGETIEKRVILSMLAVKIDEDNTFTEEEKSVLFNDIQKHFNITGYSLTIDKIIDAGKAAQKIEDYNNQIRENPDNAELYCKRAFLKSRFFRDNEDSLEDYNTAVALDQTNAEFLVERARIKFFMKDYKGALEDQNTAFNLYQATDADKTKIAKLYMDRGYLKYKYLGDLQGTLNDYNMGIEYDPQAIYLIRRGGFKQFYLKDNMGALNDYLQALEYDEENADVLSQVAYIELEFLNDPASALKYFNKAININPAKANWYLYRAYIKSRYFKDQEGALEDYNMAVKLAPQEGKYYAARAAFYFYCLHDMEKSFDDYDLAIKYDPTNAAYYYERAKKYHHIGNFTAAIKDIKNAIKYNPKEKNYKQTLHRWSKKEALKANSTHENISAKNIQSSKNLMSGLRKELFGQKAPVLAFLVWPFFGFGENILDFLTAHATLAQLANRTEDITSAVDIAEERTIAQVKKINTPIAVKTFLQYFKEELEKANIDPQKIQQLIEISKKNMIGQMPEVERRRMASNYINMAQMLAIAGQNQQSQKEENSQNLTDGLQLTQDEDFSQREKIMGFLNQAIDWYPKAQYYYMRALEERYSDPKQALKDVEAALEQESDNQEYRDFFTLLVTGYKDLYGINSAEDYMNDFFNKISAKQDKEHKIIKLSRTPTADALAKRAYEKRLKGYLATSMAYYNEAAEEDPTQGYIFFERGLLKQYDFADFIGAFDDYMQAFNLDPENGDFYTDNALSAMSYQELANKSAEEYFEKANENYEDGEVEESLKNIQQAIKLNSNSDKYYNFSAFVKIALEDYKGAYIDINKAIDINSSVAIYYANLAVIQVSKDFQDLKSGFASISKAIELSPYTISFYMSRINIRENMGTDWAGILSDWDAIIKINPVDPTSYASRAEIKYLMGDLKGAALDYSRAMNLDPYNADYPSLRGAVKIDLGDIEGGMQDLSNAIDIDKDYANPWYSRGFAKFKTGDYAGAIEDFYMAISLDPNNAIYYMNLATAKENIDSYSLEDILADYKKAAEIDPNNADAHYGIAGILEDLERYEESIEAYKKAISLDPSASVYYRELASAYFNIEKLDEALENIAMALGLDDQDPESYYIRALIKEKNNNLEQAFHDYEIALLLDPEYEDARKEYNRLKAKLYPDIVKKKQTKKKANLSTKNYNNKHKKLYMAAFPILTSLVVGIWDIIEWYNNRTLEEE